MIYPAFPVVTGSKHHCYCFNLLIYVSIIPIFFLKNSTQHFNLIVKHDYCYPQVEISRMSNLEFFTSFVIYLFYLKCQRINGGTCFLCLLCFPLCTCNLVSNDNFCNLEFKKGSSKYFCCISNEFQKIVRLVEIILELGTCKFLTVLIFI